MRLPQSLRDYLMEELEDFLSEAEHDAEGIAGFMVELIETYGDEHEMEEIVTDIEDRGGTGTLLEILEGRIHTDIVTAAELVRTLEEIGAIEWVDDLDFEDEEDDLDF